jgi:hypothetical protein
MGTGCANCWPPLVSLHPSLWSLWVALTHWGYGSCILCWCRWSDVRGVGEAGKLSLPGPLLCLRGPSHLTTNAGGFEAGGRPCAPLHSCVPPAILSLPPSLCLDKKEKRGQKKGESEREKWEIGSNTRVLKALTLPSP